MTSTDNKPVAHVPAGIYAVEASTTVAFTTTHWFGLGAVTGTFALLSGNLNVPESLEAVTATVAIDSGSFDTGTPARDKKVRGKMLLDSARHPRIDVAVERIDLNGDHFTGRGTLTVRGTTAPLDITITSVQVTQDTVRAELTARVDRYALGVTKVRGVAARHLDLRVRLVATRQA